MVYLYGLGTISPSNCAGILKQSMGARNRVGIGLSYRPARLNSLADWFLGIDPSPVGENSSFFFFFFVRQMKNCMVEEPSHGGEQLSLKHVCNIGLIQIAHKINYVARKADVWMTALLLQCFCQYFFMKLGEAFVEPRPNPQSSPYHATLTAV
jgi:hypothetical protein